MLKGLDKEIWQLFRVRISYEHYEAYALVDDKKDPLLSHFRRMDCWSGYSAKRAAYLATWRAKRKAELERA